MRSRGLIGLLVWAGLAGGLADPVARAAEPGVGTADRGRLVVEEAVEGWLEARSRQDVLAPALEGHPRWSVSRVVPSGETVAKGQTVVELDPAEAAWRLRRAQGRLDLRRARREAAKAHLAAERLERELDLERAGFGSQRAELMAKKGVGMTPRLAVERAALDRKAAGLRAEQERGAMAAHDRRAKALLLEEDLAVERAQLAVDQARSAVAATRLVATSGGRVRLAPGVEAGAVVRAGQRLAEVLVPEQIQARFRIRVDPATPILPDALVGLGAPALGEKRVGITLVSTRLVQPDAGAPGQVELLVAPRSRVRALAPGDPVWLWIRRVLARDALLVPAQAVLHRPAGPMVWSLEAPAGWRRVELGRRTPELVEIRSGLAEGERVSLDPRAQARAAGASTAKQPAQAGGQENGK